MLKDRLNHLFFSHRFYKAFIRPLDRILFPIVALESLQKERRHNPVPLNKIPQVSDLENSEWSAVLDDMAPIFTMDMESFHRKHWEFVQLVYMLARDRRLHPQAACLAVGAGREPVVYYLTHKVRRVTGVDLYAGTYLGGEDEPDIPDHPAKYAPFVCPPQSPDLRRMDARNLDFKDNSYDFVFSASSIEHFGDMREIRRSLEEMYRVLKPGGAAAITTEIRLNRLGRSIPNTRIFHLDTLLNLCRGAGFTLDVDSMDMRIEAPFHQDPVKLPEQVLRRPHVILRYFSTWFSSLSLLLCKPGTGALRGEWRANPSITPLDYNARITAEAQTSMLSRGARMQLQMKLENTGNFDWYTGGGSHRIAVGVQLRDRSDGLIDRDFHQFTIPRDLPRGDSLSFVGSVPLALAPGKYRLWVTLKREFITWFPESSCPPARVDFQVS
ncbi:MAG: methyltransferase domain-containing protein [Candidatus Aminicenantes bacterium]|nr:methyltransferase domain-containing protein [Candidatus Aminicenantes bacterium]